MSTFTDKLKSGMTALHAQAGQSFTFEGTSFTAIVGDPKVTDLELAGYESWNLEHEFFISVDPEATAFASGLPETGDYVLKDSKYYRVVEIRFAPGHHTAYLSLISEE